MSTKKKTAKKETVSATITYIGPTIQNVVVKGESFKNGKLPATLQEYSKTNPAVSILLVTSADLPAALKSIQSQTGAYWAAYKKLSN